MQIGSLVECLKSFPSHDDLPQRPVQGGIYTVRAIYHKGDDIGIQLEECVNPPMQHKDGFAEAFFDVNHFRELQPPQTINIESLISEPVLTDNP